MTPGTASAQVDGPASIRAADFTTLPNLVSLARIVGVSAAVLLYFAGYPRVTVVLGTLACLTDHLDGYLARRLNQETVLGAMLDQAADSYTTAIAMAMLVATAAWLEPIAVVSMAVGLLLSWAAAWRYTRVLVRRVP